MTNRQLKHRINDLVTVMDIVEEEVEYTVDYYEGLLRELGSLVSQHSANLSPVFGAQDRYKAYVGDVQKYLSDSSIPIVQRIETFKDVSAGYLIGGLA